MKAFFLSRLLREKILLLGMIAVATVIWLSSVNKRARQTWQSISLTRSDLADQRQWLADRAQVEARAKAAVEHLDPRKTFDRVRLQAELDSIANSAGVGTQTSIDDAQTVLANQFSVNTVRFQIRNAQWESLERFYQELAKRSPYVGIEEFTIVVNRNNRLQLTALLKVSSVEISR